MNEQRLEITNDAVYAVTPLPQFSTSNEVVKMELVMTKEVFQKCYKKWILEDNKDE